MLNYIKYQGVRSRRRQSLESLEPEQNPTVENESAQSQEIDDLLRVLSAKQRQAFELRFLRDHTLAETAKRMGLAVSTLSEMIGKAKKRLKKELR